MKDDHTPLVEAALGAFLQFGFRRTTMGDIAKAAGLSRQSLYARFANKDEVYAAGLELFAGRMMTQLHAAWARTDDIGARMDALAEVMIIPYFDLLRSNPNAADLVEGAETPEGRAAMDKVTSAKVAMLTDAFAPHAEALQHHGLTPADLADFVENAKQMMISSAKDRADLDRKIATLRASVVALAAKAP